MVDATPATPSENPDHASGVSPIVQTRSGEVRGRVVEGVYLFKGIPFAAAPFGPHHLHAPQPVTPWSGVRDALEEGAKPPQPPFPGTDPNAPPPWDRARQGEDCLNLNVWSPALDGRSPVVVWVTGGSFMAGSAAWYDGRRFARDGVVCVAINYRSGAEGFLYLEDGVPNRGLLDQLAALEWVRDNIDRFGGDPDNVTLCGESAGAMCIGALLAVPRARGLFRRAILQSGAAHHVLTRASAQRMSEALGAILDVDPRVEAMAAVAPARLLNAQMELVNTMMEQPDAERWGREVVASMMPFHIVIDGDVLPADPMERIRSGAASAVDVLVGTNVDDWRLFLAFTGALHQITDDNLTGLTPAPGFPALSVYGLPVERALAAYRAWYPDAIPGEVLAAIETDWWCRIPAIRLADAHVNDGSRTYMYEFAWRSPVGDGLFGACHALEIPFVFDTVDDGPDQMLGELLGDHPPQALAHRMHSEWVSFITRGAVRWPEYELKRRATMRFDNVSQVLDDPRARERTLWEGTR